ncbi:MAG: Cu(I)-responsive transcriptional regulator [Pseudomonadota bacterium]
MNIGDVAARTGLSAKTIRYYEDIGLLTPRRSANGYRVYTDSDAHKLTFLCRARALGFSIQDCRNLLMLWEDRSRASADVRAIAAQHLKDIESKINDLTAMCDTLSNLVQKCSGDDRPDCPILTGLAGS